MGIKIGIDLGTTFSAVATLDQSGRPYPLPNDEGEYTTPSIVQIKEDGSVVVGIEAGEAYASGEYGCASAFKRRMDSGGEVYCSFHGKDYTPIQLSSFVLKRLKNFAEKALGEPIEEAVVTVPAYFGNEPREATLQAAKLAGLKVSQLVNEPTAAVMQFGIDNWRKNAIIMIYDLGGGTFDVTLVQMQGDSSLKVLNTQGDHYLGGKDWDERIVQILALKIEETTGYSVQDDVELRNQLARSAENVKKKLSQVNSCSVPLTIPSCGRVNIEITREEFENATRDLLDQTLAICEIILTNAGLAWRDVDDVVLVGGSTRMPQTKEALTKKRNKPPLVGVDPDLAVACGAAIQANISKQKYCVLSSLPASREIDLAKKPSATGRALPAAKPLAVPLSILAFDVTAHALGVVAVDAEGENYVNETILPANQQIPVKRAKKFSYFTSFNDEDNQIEIYVLQGTKPPIESDVVGKYVVSGLKHNPKANPTLVRIQYSYDQSGVVHVQARQNDDDFDLPIRKEPCPEDVSQFGRPVERKRGSSQTSLVLAIDVSGSMHGEPIQKACEAARHCIDELQGYDSIKIGFVVFSDRTETIVKPTNDHNHCSALIQTSVLGKTGNCNRADPLSNIYKMLRKESGEKRALILTDGQWEWNAVNDAKEFARKCSQEGIEIKAIGFGHADYDFLEEISSPTLQAEFASSLEELKPMFGAFAQVVRSDKDGARQDQYDESEADTWETEDEQ